MTHTTDPPVSDASPEQGSTLTTSDQAFDWTRQLRPDMRSLVTFWLETDIRVMRYVSIVPAAGGVR